MRRALREGQGGDHDCRTRGDQNAGLLGQGSEKGGKDRVGRLQQTKEKADLRH